MNALEKLSEELRNITLDRKEGFDKKSNELIGCLSMRVFGAINPVDCVTASFTTLVLQKYEEEIFKAYPEAEDIVRILKDIYQDTKFIVPIKAR
ncbi:MAG: hypothetical protein ACLVAH_04745 [Anaeromassilibacillus sp.]